ncbi:MAG: sigma 54-interacting transcriptional regulator, partial [Edaphobacter sp.]
VGDSPAMTRLRLQIRRIGPHFRTVLLSGETGSGKERTARALHRSSLGADGPFVSAASVNRIGYLMKVAQGGTLFFDAIGEMSPQMQDELVELLRKHEWAQQGLAAPQKTHPRIIASTNQDLRALAASGRFRLELYQRLAMVQIALPPLRERIEDLPALAAHFLGRFSQRHRKNVTISQDAMTLLQSHGWPGNIQELESMLEAAALRSKSEVIQSWQLPMSGITTEIAPNMRPGKSMDEPARLQDVVDRHVLQVLRSCAGNKLRAAELLGISRSTLYRMLDACASSAALERTPEQN